MYVIDRNVTENVDLLYMAVYEETRNNFFPIQK